MKVNKLMKRSYFNRLAKCAYPPHFPDDYGALWGLGVWDRDTC